MQKAKRSEGRPPFQPTDRQRIEVKALVGCGVSHEGIGIFLKISKKTVDKHFAEELNEGREFFRALAKGKLAQKIIEGNLTAIIFYLKTQCGWSEKTRHELGGIDGQPLDLGKCPDVDLARLIAALTASVSSGSSDE